jgi:hypothetical protein
MTMIVVPSNENVPLIADVQGTPQELAEKAKIFFDTLDVLKNAGVEVEVTEEDREESRNHFTGSVDAPKNPSSSAVVEHLRALITEYDHQVLESNIQARNYIMNRLIELSSPMNKPMEQLRALELMGKVSEVGMFTERIELSINTKTSEELENELVQTLSKYMGDVKEASRGSDPILGIDLDEELGRKPKKPLPVLDDEENTQ